MASSKKQYTNLLLSLGLLSIIIAASTLGSLEDTSTRSYTAISLVDPGKRDSGLLVATKRLVTGSQLESSLHEVDLDSLQRVPLEVPEEVRQREIIGLFPGETKVFVLFSQTPQSSATLYEFKPRNKRWKRVQDVPCELIAQVRMVRNRMRFVCREQDERIKFSYNPFSRGETRVALPQRKTVSGTLRVELTGDYFKWNSLTIKQGDQVRKVAIKEF